MPESVYIEEGINRHKAAKGDRIVAESGGEIRLKSGAKFVADAGAIMNLSDEILDGSDLALADAKVFIGNADGAATAVTPSGDWTISNTGVATIGAAKVTPSKTSTGVARGKGASYLVDATGAQTALLAASAAGETRHVMGRILVDTVFANGDGAQPVFIIGETGTTNKFVANTVLVDASAGAVFTFAGTLTAEAALFVTATAGTGTATGAITVNVIAVAE